MFICIYIYNGFIEGDKFYTFLKTSINETHKHLVTGPNATNNHYNNLIELVINNFPKVLLLNATNKNLSGPLSYFVMEECKNYIKSLENNISFRIMLNIFYVNVYSFA